MYFHENGEPEIHNFFLADPILQTVERIQCNKFLYYLINTGHFFKLISLLNDNTVFAPTDEAFDRLSQR